MYKILFVCHGNICRSPMAEFIMKQLVRQQGLGKEFLIASAATTSDEIGPGGLGHPLDPRTTRELEKENVPYTAHFAHKMGVHDYQKYDYLICMDEENFLDMNHLTSGDPQHKEYKLLYFAGSKADIEDPWYTKDFTTAFNEIKRGCEGLLKYLLKNKD